MRLRIEADMSYVRADTDEELLDAFLDVLPEWMKAQPVPLPVVITDQVDATTPSDRVRHFIDGKKTLIMEVVAISRRDGT